MRARLSPTIDRFMAANFIGPFFVCLAAFTITYLIGDIFDRFDDLMHYGGFSLLGLRYFALKIPLIVSQLLPVACLSGALLGLAILSRSGEILACQQLGISRLELAVPILALAFVISIFNFVISETVVPYTTRQARYLYEVELKRRTLRGVFANAHIWVRVSEGFLSADRYDAHQHELWGVTLYRLTPDFKLHDIVRARRARWNGTQWAPQELSTIELGPHDSVSTVSKSYFRPDINPADFGLLKLDPEEFTLWELDRYIVGLCEKGLDPGGYVVDRDLKYALPLSCLIMVALGVVLSLDPLPRRLSLGRSFGLALAIGFGYWVMLGITSSLGRSELMPPWTAAWVPNLLFSVIALSLFLFGEER